MLGAFATIACIVAYMGGDAGGGSSHATVLEKLLCHKKWVGERGERKAVRCTAIGENSNG
jgi:hypothetical protein